MGKTKIEWTDATWNPIRARNRFTGKVGWFCTHVSAGCANCYAEGFNARLGTGLPYKPSHLAEVEIYVDEKMLAAPLHWGRPRMIFVGSMTDLFADFVTDAMLDRIFAVMAIARRHIFQALTKRSDRMRSYLSNPQTPARIARACVDLWLAGAVVPDNDWPVDSVGPIDLPDDLVMRVWPLPNILIGTSCEDQATADARIPDLLATPAAIRFVSAEPLLGPIDFTWIAQPDDSRDGVIDALLGCDWIDGAGKGVTYLPTRPGHAGRRMTREVAAVGTKLDWIIVGGESGPHARPMYPQWARDIRDQCAAASVSFHFKQWGE